MVDEPFVLLNEVFVLHYNTAKSSLVWRRCSSVRTLATGWTTEESIFDSRQGQSFSSSPTPVWTACLAQPVSCLMYTKGTFIGARS